MHRVIGPIGGLLLLLAAGCDDACIELQDICNGCRDPNQKASCERSVDEDPEDVCELNVDAYRNICR
jgi:hypothetical protein